MKAVKNLLYSSFHFVNTTFMKHVQYEHSTLLSFCMNEQRERTIENFTRCHSIGKLILCVCGVQCMLHNIASRM